MYISGTTQAIQGTQTSGGLAGTLGTDTTQTFLTLLTTQLKTQDPTSPMDPTAMVGQLVQFNTLGQIMEIRKLLENASSSQATPAGTVASANTGGN